MAVKKATSAAKAGVQPKKVAPTRAGATKARETRLKEAKPSSKSPAKAGATKVTASSTSRKSPVKTGTTSATRAASAAPAKALRGRGSGAAKATRASDQPQHLRVRENEKPWTARELAAVRAELEADIARLQKEISDAELDLAGLMRDAGEGAGDDQADAGTATFEREQEISLANNAREVFEQSARALARLLDGTYGICESCGNPIGKNRLLAFPRATLCMTCKSKQERR